MTIDEARTELATIMTAIGEYVSGRRKKRFKVLSAGVQRETEFASPEKMFEYLTKRRNELEAFIASLETNTTTLAASFTQNKNFPMVFRRNG